jgi:hypothetical protein
LERQLASLHERGGFEPPVPRGLLWARIRPEFGAVFGPTKSTRAVQNLFVWNSTLLRLSPARFVRQFERRSRRRRISDQNFRFKSEQPCCWPEFLPRLFSSTVPSQPPQEQWRIPSFARSAHAVGRGQGKRVRSRASRAKAWEVRPVLIMHEEDWPAPDGSSGITSVKVGFNFFLFFSSKVGFLDALPARFGASPGVPHAQGDARASASYRRGVAECRCARPP